MNNYYKTPKERIRLIKKGKRTKGPVIYWMSSDQRVADNWALIFASELSKENNLTLIVAFNLVPEFLGATLRQYDFMLKGLIELESKLVDLNIPFILTIGDPIENIPKIIKDLNACFLVTEFDPLKLKKNWKFSIQNQINIPFFEVDTHHIVPVEFVSNKMEYSAKTLRPKIQKLLPNFLSDFPDINSLNQKNSLDFPKVDWKTLYNSLNVDKTVTPVNWIVPGENSAIQVLNSFIQEKIEKYQENRNDPTKDFTSKLSPYLHFGQISSQRIALEILKICKGNPSAESFLEELIVRRELASNYCHYNKNYDNFNGFPSWAKQTLIDHINDPREYLYTLEEFELGNTHDELWNYAQKQIVHFGWLNGYLRMYWAKKILEWTPNPYIAQQWAIYLNDKYQIDGRDANGYTGIAWSIGGVHDRPWFDRKIFGKIRYMNNSGARRKFDVDYYIKSLKLKLLNNEEPK